MKLKPTIQELDVKLDGFNFNEVFDKTLKEVKSSYFDSPELFISTFVSNSEQLQALGDSNGYEDIDTVIKAVIDEIKKKQIHGDTEIGLAKLVIQVLGKKYEKPKPQPKPSTSTSSSSTSSKPQTLEYDLEEGLMGLEIKWDKKETLSKEEFEEKFKKTHGENYDYKFEYSETKVKASTISKEKNKDEEVEEKLLFTVETNEEVDPDDEDAEPTFVIRKPDGELLEDESGDNDGEPQVFDTEEEAQTMAKQLNISLKEKEEKPKKEKKLKKAVETEIVKPSEDEVLEEKNEKKTELPEPQAELPKVEPAKVEKEKKKKEEKVIETNDDLDW